MKYGILLSVIMSVALIGCQDNGVGSSLNSLQSLELETSVSKSMTKSLLSNSNENILHGLNDVTTNGSLYVAVGNDGIIIYSNDGMSWDSIVGITAVNLHAITYNQNNKLFYAVGDGGLVISSADAVNWNIYKRLNPAQNLLSIYTKNGDEFIGAESGYVFEVDTSSPRSTVTVRQVSDDGDVNTIAANNDLMVLGTSKGGIYFKQYEGYDWQNVSTHNSLNYSDMYFDKIDGDFIATSLNGYVMRSKNGMHWSLPVQAVANTDKGFKIKSISVEPNTYKYLLGGGDQNDTFISSSDDFNRWNTVSYGNLGSINKVKCFATQGWCLAIGENSTMLRSSYDELSQSIKWDKIHYNNSIISAEINIKSTAQKKDYIAYSIIASNSSNESFDYTSFVDVTSSNPSIAEINSIGKIYAKNNGSTLLTFKLPNGLKFEKNLTVIDKAVTIADPKPGTYKYDRDALTGIPVGTMGLKTYVLTNMMDFNLTVRSVIIPANDFITLDLSKTTCYKNSDILQPINLQPGASCTIVYKYLPKIYETYNTFNSYVIFNDDVNKEYISASAIVPYSGWIL
ncbi:MAG: hypothetical protein PHC75_01330 [Burkholderiales bacterium]|nr:hypothetical protein [Burkholderiales bacterium]